ncbi:MAG: class I SAM-dependent methyltransferase [Candidatus Hydrothermae bacterium]|nr:class I SAM-dependent methyltransferase [Candidatus Hydrothermae bacterium]
MDDDDRKYVEISKETWRRLLEGYGKRNFNIRFWNGEVWEAEEKPDFTLVLNHPGSLRAAMLPPTELNLAEAYLYGDIDIEGKIEAIFPVADFVMNNGPRLIDKLGLARLLMSLPKKKKPRVGKREPARLKGKKHSRERDRLAVTYHYNLPNEFYSLWLDKNMVYSCAYFRRGDESIDDAQENKLEYIARKLRLKPGERLLDIGCGWGSFVVHAAKKYGVRAYGITLSENQVEWAKEWIEREGLSDLCTVELRDYRDLDGVEEFDKIVSIGMFEHVGEKMLGEYFGRAYRLLKPGGLFLNHGIARHIRNVRTGEKTFSDTYVFPDGELEPISLTLRVAEEKNFEVRDVESLREHYARTLRLWVERLEERHDEAVRVTDEVTYRVWRLFMSGSAYGFETGRLNLYQTLLSKPDKGGRTYLPLTREDLYVL